MSRFKIRPNTDAGSVRSHTRPDNKRRILQSWKDWEVRDHLQRSAARRDFRHSQPVPKPGEAIFALFDMDYDDLFDDGECRCCCCTGFCNESEYTEETA
jgi:hypothetical protein